MRLFTNKWVFIVGFGALATGCGGLARSGVSDDPPGQTNPSSLPQKFPSVNKSSDAAGIPAAPEKPAIDPKLELEMQNLSGLWSKSCVKGGAGESSSRSAIEFSGNIFNLYTYKYSDNDCQIQVSQSRVEGTYKLVVSDSAGLNAIDLMSEDKIYYRFFSDKAVKEASAAKVCGKTSWRQSAEQGCAENDPRSVFDIVKISSTSLTFGAADASHDGSSGEKRHAVLDESAVFQKKK